jgi:hypothetical protein
MFLFSFSSAASICKGTEGVSELQGQVLVMYMSAHWCRLLTHLY